MIYHGLRASGKYVFLSHISTGVLYTLRIDAIVLKIYRADDVLLGAS
jgi:hypothetical protein